MSHQIPGRRNRICMAESLERRVLFAVAEAPIAVNAVSGQQIELLGSNLQELMTITPQVCNADLDIRGLGLSEKRVGNNIEVEGSDFSVDSVNLINSSARSSLTFKGFSDFDLTVNELRSTGPVGRIDAPAVNFDGSIDLAAVEKFRANSISDAIALFGAGEPMKQFGVSKIIGSQITFNSPVNLFQAESILPSTTTGGSLPPYSSITGSSFNQFNVVGDANMNLTVRGGPKFGLNFAYVHGSASGTWNVDGLVNSILVGSVAKSWQTNLNTGFRYIWSKGEFDGTLNSPVGGTLRMGSSDGAVINLTQKFVSGRWDLDSLIDSGAFNNSMLASAGSIRSIDARSMLNSQITAGMIPDVSISPTIPLSDFTSTASIDRVSIANYSKSLLGAAFLNLALLGDVDTTDPEDFGVIAFRIILMDLSFGSQTTKRIFAFRKLVSLQTLLTQASVYGLKPQDFGNFDIVFPSPGF